MGGSGEVRGLGGSLGPFSRGQKEMPTKGFYCRV